MLKKVLVSPLGELTEDTRTIGDDVNYRIYYPRPDPKAGKVVITDVLDKHLNSVRVANGGKLNRKTNTIVWVLSGLFGKEIADFVEFHARIGNVKEIRNHATMSIEGEGKPIQSNEVITKVLAPPKIGWIPFLPDAQQGEPPRVYMKDETTTGVTLRFDVAGVFVYEKRVDGIAYQRVSIPARGTHTDVGKPELPITGEAIEVPFNTQLTPELVKSQTTKLQGYNIYPVQPPETDAAKTHPPFTIERATYLTNRDYPGKFAFIEEADITVIRGHRVALLKINPVQYNPVTKEIIVNHVIEVRLKYDHPAQLTATNRRIRSKAFEDLLKATILNYKDPKRFSPSPDSGGTDGPDAPDGPAGSQGCDYLIITHDAFYDEKKIDNPVAQLANWKTRKGYRTKIVKVGSIPGGNNAASIKAYIKTAYDTWSPPPTYVLLIGDSDLIAANPGMKDPGTTQPAVETDLYYACVDGGADDYFPDIYVGRLSADSLQQVNDIVNKILTYEKTPPDPASKAAFYSNITVLGLFCDIDQKPSNIADGREDRPWIANLETTRQFLLGQNYTVQRIYNTDSGFPSPNCWAPSQFEDGTNMPNDLVSPQYGWNLGKNDVSSAFNNGRFLFIYRDHGAWDSWSTPLFANGDVANLNQNGLTSVIFSIACQNGWFDNETAPQTAAQGGPTASQECFAETLLRLPKAGTVGILALTRDSYTKWNDYLMFGHVKAIWPSFTPAPHWSEAGTVPEGTEVRLLHLGQILVYGKVYMATRYTASDTRKLEFEMEHLFGDPETQILTSAPDKLTARIPKGIGATGLQEFVVYVNAASNSQPVENATAVLTRADQIVQMQQTDAWGIAHFALNNLGAGDLDTTITADNFIPFLDTIKVKSGAGVLDPFSPPDGPENSYITVGGKGFLGGETVDIYLADQLQTSVKAEADGSFGQGTPSTNITIPLGYQLGPVNAWAHGQTSDLYATRVFLVRKPNPIDLWTYSQWDQSTWWLNPSDNPTWDSPDIQLYDSSGNPVASNNLLLNQTYTIQANIRSKTAFEAKQTKIIFKWMDFGAGGPWQDLATVTLDVPANPPGITIAKTNFRPPVTGHQCVKVVIEHIEDTNLANNEGQENLHVGPTSSPAEVFLTVWNTTKKPAPVNFEVRQLIEPGKEKKQQLWGTLVKHPNPQIIPAGKMARASILVEPDVPHNDVGVGEKADFAVTCFINGRIIGGANLSITKR